MSNTVCQETLNTESEDGSDHFDDVCGLIM